MLSVYRYKKRRKKKYVTKIIYKFDAQAAKKKQREVLPLWCTVESESSTSCIRRGTIPHIHGSNNQLVPTMLNAPMATVSSIMEGYCLGK